MRKAAIIAAALFLSACDTPTVDWYEAHDDERREKLAACANDPGFARIEPACENARAAQRRELYGGSADMPRLR